MLKVFFLSRNAKKQCKSSTHPFACARSKSTRCQKSLPSQKLGLHRLTFVTMISRQEAAYLCRSLILAARDQVRHFVAAFFQHCEQIFFAIGAHAFGHQIKGYCFQIAELRDRTRSRQIAEFINDFSLKNSC